MKSIVEKEDGNMSNVAYVVLPYTTKILKIFASGSL